MIYFNFTDIIASIFLESKLDRKMWDKLHHDYVSIKTLCKNMREEMESMGLPRHR